MSFPRSLSLLVAAICVFIPSLALVPNLIITNDQAFNAFLKVRRTLILFLRTCLCHLVHGRRLLILVLLLSLPGLVTLGSGNR